MQSRAFVHLPILLALALLGGGAAYAADPPVGVPPDPPPTPVPSKPGQPGIPPRPSPIPAGGVTTQEGYGKPVPRLELPPEVEAPGRRAEAAETALWPEEERAFFSDGPALLVPRAERDRMAALPAAERAAAVRQFLATDPLPETSDNELALGIERRQKLVATRFLSPVDDRARALFLLGEPTARQVLDCGQAFNPLELWDYPGQPRLIFYKPETGGSWRMWLPIDSKRALYNDEMEYFLEQLEELKGRVRTRGRFDRVVCPQSKEVDEATGIDGLFEPLDERPTQAMFEAVLAAPADLAAWARAAVKTPLPEAGPALPVAAVELQFPEWKGQRLVTRMLVTLPPAAGIEPFLEDENAKPELRLVVEGVVEQRNRIFEDFRVRYRMAPPAAETPIVLVVERALRPDLPFVMRLRLRDEVSGREVLLARGFAVPRQPRPVPALPVPEEALVALGDELAAQRVAGKDSLVLVPPETDVVLGLWRADALVSGERIVKVVFSVDGAEQMTRTRPPFSAEVRLAKFPVEQTIGAVGYDEAGAVVASDEVVLNQPRGALRVRILEPRRGTTPVGRVPVRVEIVVPEGRRVESVEISVNEHIAATLEQAPWQATVEVPPGTETTYVTATARLDDGTTAEDVRFVRAPEYLEELEVDLVELYTTVVGRNGRPVDGVAAEEFEILEDGTPQKIARFEQVKDLPLQLGIVLDTSGSMVEALAHAQQAGREFLEGVMTPRDKAFIIGFADKPAVLVPPTGDLPVLLGGLEGLQAYGWTALHDSLMTSLYYFRGMRGRRALVLLSDGDDTSSATGWRDALEYARRSGVSIYTIGLNVGTLDVSVRQKLKDLAETTGGRSFFVGNADELTGVYDEIEEELRSQYLLAYSSNSRKPAGEFRAVEVKVKRSGLKARTIGGYWP